MLIDKDDSFKTWRARNSSNRYWKDSDCLKLEDWFEVTSIYKSWDIIKGSIVPLALHPLVTRSPSEEILGLIEVRHLCLIEILSNTDQELSPMLFEDYLRNVLFLLADWFDEDQQNIMYQPGGFEWMVPFISSQSSPMWNSHDELLEDNSGDQCSNQMGVLFRRLSWNPMRDVMPADPQTQLSADFTSIQNKYLVIRAFHIDALGHSILKPIDVPKISHTAERLSLPMSSEEIHFRHRSLQRLLSTYPPRPGVQVEHN